MDALLPASASASPRTLRSRELLKAPVRPGESLPAAADGSAAGASLPLAPVLGPAKQAVPAGPLDHQSAPAAPSKPKKAAGAPAETKKTCIFTHHTITSSIPWEKQKEVPFIPGARCVDTLTLTPPRASDPAVTLKAGDEVRYWANKVGKRKLWWAINFFYHDKNSDGWHMEIADANDPHHTSLTYILEYRSRGSTREAAEARAKHWEDQVAAYDRNVLEDNAQTRKRQRAAHHTSQRLKQAASFTPDLQAQLAASQDLLQRQEKVIQRQEEVLEREERLMDEMKGIIQCLHEEAAQAHVRQSDLGTILGAAAVVAANSRK